MAKILYEVKQNQNEHNAAFGKRYAKSKSLETLNTRRLAQHIAEHGSIYAPAPFLLDSAHALLIHGIFGSECSPDECLNIFCDECFIINMREESQHSRLVGPHDFN